MNVRNNKDNLKELFEKFVEGKEAEQAVEDIQKGEQILRSHRAPEPDNELITNIKTEIAARLLHKKEKAFRRTVYKTAAVAAGFILIAVIGVKLFEKPKVEPAKVATDSTIPKTVWESERLADDDADSATLVDEVEQIESEVLALQSGENSDNGHETITELEMELTDTNSDFWKG